VRRGVRCDSNFSIDDFNRLTAEQRKLEAVWEAFLDRILRETERIAQEAERNAWAIYEALHHINKKTQEALSLGRRIEALKRVKGKAIERET
jgi:Txe/YoeB family toxin of Txe-Axe toxin-antitoxin module